MTAGAAGAAGAADSRVRLLVLTLLGAVGGTLLAIIATTFWMVPNDSLAYWLAGNRLATGLPIYEPPAIAFDPYAYHYPPPMAQVLAPLTLVIPALWFCVLYRVLMLLVLWDLAGRNMLKMLALIAIVPIAIAVRIENVELFMALAIVLGLRRWPWLFSVAALVKISPGLGVVYLALRRRWRDVLVSTVIGIGIAGVSFALAPELWQEWLGAITGRGAIIGNSLLPVPYVVRALAAFGITVVAGVLGRRTGELLLVVAVTLANPGLSLQGFAVLAAMIPIWQAGPEGLAGQARERGRRTSSTLSSELAPSA